MRVPGAHVRLLLVIALVSLIVTSEAAATVAVQRDDTVWVASGNEPRLRRLVRGTNPVVVPGGHVVVVRSPDGEQLLMVPARGGVARTIDGIRLSAREPLWLKGGTDGRHVLVQRMEGPDAIVDTASGSARELATVRGFGAVAPGGAEVAYVRRLGQAGCDLAIANTLSGETRSLRRTSCGAGVDWGSRGLWLTESSDLTTVMRIVPETGEVQARTRTRLTLFPVDVAADGALRLHARYDSGPEWAATIAADGRLTRRRIPSPILHLYFTAGQRVAFAQRYDGVVMRYAFATGARRTLARGCTAVSAG